MCMMPTPTHTHAHTHTLSSDRPGLFSLLSFTNRSHSHLVDVRYSVSGTCSRCGSIGGKTKTAKTDACGPNSEGERKRSPAQGPYDDSCMRASGYLRFIVEVN